ncbi:hypothetical protein OGR47_07170 [Methylocystis sp. MJC1]|uniref:hypothetical protein n=1 Tax=Methylocystis sp. MJC1 TaxID=2654282 RepID=UPI0013EC4C82|nr:hypothetical protein [Methylocystis sp. MJC1]MBU6526779.1 hypothetical protein [Methylocystis sp. MJC1]UZX13213.1 hypothetical protein OGR47_07170 [Methylocystis sp. MJC1]
MNGLPEKARRETDRFDVRAPHFFGPIRILAQRRLYFGKKRVDFLSFENAFLAHCTKNGGKDDINSLELKIGSIHGALCFGNAYAKLRRVGASSRHLGRRGRASGERRAIMQLA